MYRPIASEDSSGIRFTPFIYMPPVYGSWVEKASSIMRCSQTGFSAMPSYYTPSPRRARLKSPRALILRPNARWDGVCVFLALMFSWYQATKAL